jgi:GlpG protein
MSVWLRKPGFQSEVGLANFGRVVLKCAPRRVTVFAVQILFMRHIGQLPDEAQARVFGDFLLGCGVPNNVEREDDGSWTVWIIHDEHLATAQSWLAKYRTDPEGEDFRRASAEAAKVRKAQAEELAAYRKRIHSRRSIFPQFGGYGVGVLTYALIIVCIAVAVFTSLGKNPQTTPFFFISAKMGDSVLEEVRAGQVWRLLTPILLHLGITHIVFNLLALYQLGCMIEARQSTRLLATLVVVLGVFSNLAQYLFVGPGFGGMSGVVYGLIGYIWMRGKFDRTSGLALDKTYLIIALAWFVACFLGWLGPIANTAHAAGLLLGMAWGRLAAMQKAKSPD